MKRVLFSLLLASQLPAALAAEPQVRAFHPPSREQLAMRIVVRKLLLERYDTNHDSHLNGDERRSLMEDARAAREEQARAFIRRFDADGDGRLTPEERATMQQELESHRRQENGQAPPPRPQRPKGHHPHRDHRPHHPHMGREGRIIAFMVRQLTMEAYDADRNGILDTAESARLREEGVALYAAREAELLARFDADQDGHISEAELAAAREALAPRRKKKPEEMPPAPPRHPRHGPIQHLLDTHFDLDILRNLSRPSGEEPPAPPCNTSTPSTT